MDSSDQTTLYLARIWNRVRIVRLLKTAGDESALLQHSLQASLGDKQCLKLQKTITLFFISSWYLNQ